MIWLYEHDDQELAKQRIREVINICTLSKHGFMIEAKAGDTIIIGPGWAHLVTVPVETEGITMIYALEFGIKEFV